MLTREMKSFLWTAVLFAVTCAAVLAIKPPEAKSQCPGGNCPTAGRQQWRQPSPRIDVQAPGVDVRIRGGQRRDQPTPAWRYERPEKHRQAVVRVFCQYDVRTRSIGSGVLVRWGRRIVVLTARHVIQDAKSIIVETFRKKTYKATIIRYDAQWDCAVLAIDGQPDVEPAEMEWGDASVPPKGSVLETCGYGSDGKLASNFGAMLGYRGQPGVEAWDWLGVRGRTRAGDSGGAVFNETGRIVGVISVSNAATGIAPGTPGVAILGIGDGPEVCAIQAGRLHQMLKSL